MSWARLSVVVFRHFLRLPVWWTVGLMLGLGEIPMRLRTTATSACVVTLLKASFRPFSSPPPAQRGNPRSSLLVQAVAALRRRFTSLEALSVLLEESLASSGVRVGRYSEREPLGRNVLCCGISLTTLSSSPAGSCRPLSPRVKHHKNIP